MNKILNVQRFSFTEEILEDLILVLGPDEGFKSFMEIIKIEVTAYMENRKERFTPKEQSIIREKFGYAEPE